MALSETLILFICLLIIIWFIMGKVVEPVLVVTVTPSTYFRGETATVQITLKKPDDTPIPGKVVGVSLQPPTGDAIPLTPVTTDADGLGYTDWNVPNDAVYGEYDVTANAMFTTGSTALTGVD